MHECEVVYEDLLKQKHRRPHAKMGVLRYFADRGARVLENRFVDPVLELENEIVRNVLEIIKSGRKQEFERIKIIFSKENAKKLYGSQPLFVGMQRVVAEWEAPSSEKHVLVITYPDRIFYESVIWHARTRTSLHENYLTPNEISTLSHHHDLLFADARCDLDEGTEKALTKAIEVDKWLREVRDDDFF